MGRLFIHFLKQRNSLRLFIFLCLILTACSEEKVSNKNSIAKDESVPKKNNLEGYTVDEFFEYVKNPQFKITEKIDNTIPYYALRMFEVRTSDSALDLENARKESEPDKPVKKQESGSLNPTENEFNKLANAAHELDRIYFKRNTNTSIKGLYNFLKQSGSYDINNEGDMALGILAYKNKACRLKIEEGGHPLNYVSELKKFSQDSLFKPEFISQKNGPKNETVEYVQFVYNNILFRFRPMDQEDYYDQQIVIGAVNLALGCKNFSYRYYQLNDDVNVVFGDKSQMRSLCMKYNFVIK